ncbi:MAG TPA: MATE family efflux transporter [archaeon]|nr:MATE family efflux transporter [archaeon]
MQEYPKTFYPALPSETDPLSGSLGRRLFRIALPLIFNSGSVIFMLFCDRMFLSWYGTDEISAVWPATFLYSACMTFFYAISSFINVFVAQYHGAGNKKMCAAAVWQGIYFVLGSYLVLLCVIPLGRGIFSAFGHRPEIASLERTYYTVIMLASLMPLSNNVLAAFFTGRGLTHITMTANIIGNLVNIGLDWILIFGHLGFPRLGILGAGLATAIASTLPPAIMLARFLRKAYQPEYETRGTWRLRPRFIKRLLRIGSASGSHDVTYYFSLALFFMFMGRTLPESLAANNIAWSINDLLTLYIHGLSLAATTLLAQAVGAGKYGEAEKVTWLVLKILLLMASLIALVYLFFPDRLFAIFRPRIAGPDNVPFELILSRGKLILIFFMAYNFLVAFVYCLRQSLRGAGDTRYFLKVALFLDLLFFMPGIFLVAKFVGSNFLVLWSFLLVYLALAGSVHYTRFRRGHWKNLDRREIYEEA